MAKLLYDNFNPADFVGQVFVDEGGKEYRVLRVASGKSFVNGDVVVYGSAQNHEVTDSTTADDQKVAGIAVDAGNSGDYIRVQVGGIHNAAKINAVGGAISAGDLLAQGGTAKKANKAAATAKAGGILGLALEAVNSGSDTTKKILVRLR